VGEYGVCMFDSGLFVSVWFNESIGLWGESVLLITIHLSWVCNGPTTKSIGLWGES
jgi:hypothetical protein